MDHYIDISDELFIQIQHHETQEIILKETDVKGDISPGDTLKLYHPSDPNEALRVQVNRVDELSVSDLDSSTGQEAAVTAYGAEDGSAELVGSDSCSAAHRGKCKVQIKLIEWVFQIETELDEQLREEQMWLEGLM